VVLLAALASAPSPSTKGHSEATANTDGVPESVSTGFPVCAETEEKPIGRYLIRACSDALDDEGPSIENLLDWEPGQGWTPIGPLPEVPRVLAEAALAAPGDRPGFRVRSIKATYIKGWGREQMNRLLDFGGTGPICFAPGMPFAGADAGERIVLFVNLYDTGDRGAFSADTGYPDESFPGIDPPEVPATDPAGGDDDDHFATEVQTAIYLTAGLHILGASHAEGVYVMVGGIQVGARDGANPGIPSDFLFAVQAEGFYDLTIRTFTTEDAAQLELHELIPTGNGRFNRVLLGDLAHGASVVLLP